VEASQWHGMLSTGQSKGSVMLRSVQKSITCPRTAKPALRKSGSEQEWGLSQQLCSIAQMLTTGVGRYEDHPRLPVPRRREWMVFGRPTPVRRSESVNAMCFIRRNT
jgi:hypothetical protein